MSSRRHIKNYAAVKKAMKDYFTAELAKAQRAYLAATSGGDKATLDRSLEWRDVDLPKWSEQWTRRLEAADNAPKLLEININVHWAKSRDWGSNPTAEVWVCFNDKKDGTRSAHGMDRASGCGYDKRSAAVSGALCLGVKKGDDVYDRESKALGRAAIDRFVIEHGEELWKEYAIDRTPFPHLTFGGKGMSCFTGLFRRVGCPERLWGHATVKDYLIDYSEPERGNDVYHIIERSRI